MTHEAVVLAAGRSSRAGTFKPALDCGGVPLIVRVVRAFVGVCRRVWVVTGFRGEEVGALLTLEPGVEIVPNPDWEAGMFSSVKAGAARVSADRFFVTPGDLPLVDSALVRGLAACSGSVVVPVWGKIPGHPVLLERPWVKTILDTDARASLRSVLAGSPRTEFFAQDDGVLRDIDTGEDYKELSERMGEDSVSDAMRGLLNPQYKTGLPDAGKALVDPGVLEQAFRFHSSFPQYSPTPLSRLVQLASHWGVAELFVKDESFRFGLNAFKVLGATFAIGQVLAKRLGVSLDQLPFSILKDPATKKKIGPLTFAATTDGNHGRGVAWTAAQLGLPASIFMPKGTTANRLENIRRLGQGAEITSMNYDDTVRWVAAQAQEKQWEVIQDTAWEGYLDVPRWIMQGYSTVVRETLDQLAGAVPTHVFLQAGVGAFAALTASILLDRFGASPRIVVLEARPAECFYESIRQGKKTAVTGDLNTIMAGLACGEPNPLAWDILKECGFAFLAAPNEAAAHGMRVLGNPLAGDDRIVSGESGAIGPGVLGWLTQKAEYAELKNQLGIGPSSRILCFSTEGDTDPNVYREVVWEGAYRG